MKDLALCEDKKRASLKVANNMKEFLCISCIFSLHVERNEYTWNNNKKWQ